MTSAISLKDIVERPPAAAGLQAPDFPNCIGSARLEARIITAFIRLARLIAQADGGEVQLESDFEAAGSPHTGVAGFTHGMPR
jgi:hypothetical protein